MTALTTTAALPSPATLRTKPIDAIAGAVASSYMLDIPAMQYHSDKWAQSCSMLKPALVSPAHYLEGILHPMVSSPQMDYGTLLHTAVHEPHLLRATAAVFSGDPGDRKALRAFRDANLDRIVTTLAGYLNLKVAAGKVLEKPFRGRPFYKFVEEGLTERSVYYVDPWTGMWCRIRLDLWHPDFTFDLKSTKHVSAGAFQRAAVELEYDMQAYMYSLGRCLFEGTDSPKPFVVVQAETEAPHSVLFRPASMDFLTNGKKKYEMALSTVKGSTQVDHWPAPSGEVELELHSWQQFRC